MIYDFCFLFFYNCRQSSVIFVILNGVKNLGDIKLMHSRFFALLWMTLLDDVTGSYLNESVSNLISIIGEMRSYRML